MKEELTLYKKYERFDIACVSCGSKKHIVFDCPYVTYQPIRRNLVDKHLYSINHLRQRKYERKSIRNSFSALRDRFLLLESFQRYYDNNQEYFINAVDFDALFNIDTSREYINFTK